MIKKILFIVLVLCSFVNADLISDMESYWSCDSSDSNVTHILNDDLANQNNDGIFVNGAKIINGKVNQACNFNSADLEYIEIENSVGDYDGYSAFTVSFWIYFNSTTTTDHWFSFPFYDGATRSWGYIVTFGGTDLCARVSTDLQDDNDQACSGALGIGHWNHIVFTWDTTSDLIEIYLNASSIANTTQAGNTVRPNTADVYIGATDFAGAPNYYHNASMDEIGIWSRKFTPSEVDELNNLGDGFNPFKFYSINYISPVNNTVSSSNLTTSFSVSESGSCSIILDGTLNYTKTVILDKVYNFTLNFSQDGAYDFNINCTDGIDNISTGIYTYHYDHIPNVCSPVYLSDNLIAYYPLNESGLPYNNYVGDANLVNGNAPIMQTGDGVSTYPVYQNFSFANSDYIYSNNDSTLIGMENFTMTFFMRPHTLPDAHGFFYQDVMAHYYKTLVPPNTHYGWYLRTHRDYDTIYMEFWNESDVVQDSVHMENIALELNKWVHIAVVWDGNASFYKNGTKTTPIYTNDGTNEIGWNSDNMTMYMGDFASPFNNWITAYYNGDLAGVAYFNVSLNQTCINYTFLSTAPYYECNQNWSCNSYTCNISDSAPCTNVTDLGECGQAYTGDYSEFSPQSCNYCIHDLSGLNVSDCVDGLEEFCYEDLNFTTCCNITDLGSDCYFGNDSEGCIISDCAYDEPEDITDFNNLNGVLILLLLLMIYLFLFVVYLKNKDTNVKILFSLVAIFIVLYMIAIGINIFVSAIFLGFNVIILFGFKNE